MEYSKMCPSLSLLRALMAVFLLWACPLLEVSAQKRQVGCPPQPGAVCTCRDTSTGYSVECNNRNNVYLVPTHLTYNTTVLNLSGNKIGRLFQGDFTRLEQMRTLFLQQNEISYIQPGAFDNLYNLELLVMSDNRLTFLMEGVFAHLPAIGTIDLSNNQIQNMYTRTFLTLPASNTQSGSVTIRLNNNPLMCGCEARAIRQWKDSLGSSRGLARISLEGFTCRNIQNTQLDSVPLSSFGTCSDTQLSLFLPSQSCVACHSVSTMHSCDSFSNETCQADQTMCLSAVRIVNGVMSVSKSCGSSYADCLLRERRNNGLCNLPHDASLTASLAALDCTYCCVGVACNQADMGGRTVSFKLYVGIRMRQTFEAYMLDPSNPLYIQRAAEFKQQLQSILASENGGYSVDFLSFREESSNVYVSTLVHTTHLNVHTVQSVVMHMTDKLNISSRSGFLKTLSTNYIYVGTELATAKNCMREVTQTDSGPITWQESAGGMTVSLPCPSASGVRAFATRQCQLNSVTGVAQWAAPDVGACKAEASETTRKLSELKNTEITQNNINSVLDQLNKLSKAGADLSATDVTLTMDTVERVLAKTYALTSSAAMRSAVSVLSNLMDAEPEVLSEANTMANSADRLLQAADTISEQGTLSNGQLLLSSANLVVAAQGVTPTGFQGLTLSAASLSGAEFSAGDVTVTPEVGTPQDGSSSLVLPSSLMTSAPGSRVAMTVHQNDKVFEAIRNSQQPSGGTVSSDGSGDQKVVTKVNSHVMSASVVGHNVINLQDPVTFTLTHDNENSTNPRCVFWDEAASDWSQEGCTKVTSRSNENVTTCQCDHLTNFALLMDVFNEGSNLSETDSKILSIISYIGCGISLLALLLTLLTYCLFKKLRRDNPSKILVNLCVALALSNLVFVAGMHPYALNNIVGCKIVGVLLHFSLLASLCWMAVEAFYMYLALVLVFKTYYTNFILKCSLVGWGIPLLVIIITLSINETDNYGPLNTGVCWLKDVAFYAAFVGPVALIIVINVLAFIMVVRQIIGMKDRKLNKSDSFTVSQQLRGALGVAILLGLTWVFGFMAVSQAAVVFYYLFAIFNSLQGLWIFIFYCVMKKEARNAWLRALPCCPTFDDKSGVITTSRAGYSGSGAPHGKAASASSDSAHHTHSTSVTGSRSFNSDTDDAVYVNGGVKSDPPYANLQSDATEPSHVYINLSYSKDKDDASNSNNNTTATTTTTSPPSKGGVETTVKAYRSEGNITITTTTTKTKIETAGTKVGTKAAPNSDTAPNADPRPLQFRPGPTLTELSVNGSKAEGKGEATASSQCPLASDDPRVSPRPLHFKLGHAYSLEGGKDRQEDESTVETPSPTSAEPRATSVADMIRKINTRM